MTEAPELDALSAGATLIVGAGIAGLFTALKMAPRPVTILTAAPLGKGGSSTWAQGGLAAAVGPDDTPELHFQDTIKAGAGLVDEPATRILTEEGPARVHDLSELGIEFDRGPDGYFLLGKEAAHTRNRIVHASGDQAGATIMAGLIEAAEKAEHITIREQVVAEEILLNEHQEAFGVLAYDIKQQKRIMIASPRTILATGGVGGLYAVTTNPIHAQGHGLALAFRAGAEIMDPEFVQFHPTALDVGFDPAPLATEALRGAGARLIDSKGNRIMAGIHLDLELAPRDIVARTVAKSISTSRGAFLDARKAIGANFPKMFPTVYEACQKVRLDPVSQPIPVAPAAHYHMGGVRTDENGQTSIANLWAVGEVAATGIHGANRLASNSLLEALVFGARTAVVVLNKEAHESEQSLGFPEPRLAMPAAPATADEMLILRRLMTDNGGMIRTRASLDEALGFIHDCLHAIEMTSGYYNALTAASVIMTGATYRQESRGSHYRKDFTETRSTPSHNIIWLDNSAQRVKHRTHSVQKLPKTVEPA